MMARKKSKKTDIGILGPMIDLAGAIALGAYTKHSIKKAYEEGHGEEAAAATAVYGIGGMHKKGNHLMEIAGLHAVRSAVHEAERKKIKNASTGKHSVYSVDTESYYYEKHNNNRYAWRLNCENGSQYGIHPDKYETRDEYNAALSKAKEIATAQNREQHVEEAKQRTGCAIEKNEIFTYCRVSRLDNGINQYFICGEEIYQIGDKVLIQTEEGTVEGIVLSAEKHTALTAPIPPDTNLRIIRKL